MKKLIHKIARIFFSKEKLLLIKLLNHIQDNRDFEKQGRLTHPGICNFIWNMSGKGIISYAENSILVGIIYSNRPPRNNFGGYFFEPFQYQPRFEFLKELIKKY